MTAKFSMTKIGSKAALKAIAALSALGVAWLLGFGTASVRLSQPVPAPPRWTSATIMPGRINDVPLLTDRQKEFARQRGYVTVWIDGQHHILVNLPEEYL